MRNRLARIGLTEPLIATGVLRAGLEALPPSLPLTARAQLPIDGALPSSAVAGLFALEDAKVRRLSHLTPALRAEIVANIFPGRGLVIPSKPFKLTPRKAWVPASGALVFRNASVVAAHSDTALFGWMVNVADDISVGAMPNDGSAVDIWVSPDDTGLVLVLIRVWDSPKYVLHRPLPPNPGAAYTVTGFDGASRTEPMTGNAMTFPFVFTASDTSWRRCRIAGAGWPWRFRSAEVIHPG